MSDTEQKTEYRVYDRSGRVVEEGEMIETFGRHRYPYRGISRVPVTSGGGKIRAGDREWYPSAFGLEIREVEQGDVRPAR